MAKNIARKQGRASDQLRPISFVRNYTAYAEGSVLACYGETKVLCNASISDKLPTFLQESNQGWITAEYGMLPRSTHTRIEREASKGKQSGRTLEIQRLIGRSLRAAVDLTILGRYAITLDCDVIQADGGTRTASISGCCIALIDAINYLQKQGKIQINPFKHLVAAVSVGIYQGVPMLDLDYDEDSQAHTDMNVVMNDQEQFIELQGTAEGQSFNLDELNGLLKLAKKGIKEIVLAQRQCLDKC